MVNDFRFDGNATVREIFLFKSQHLLSIDHVLQTLHRDGRVHKFECWFSDKQIELVLNSSLKDRTYLNVDSILKLDNQDNR